MTRASEPPKSVRERPLDFGIIRRLFSLTRPHARLRNWVLFFVLIRAAQLPVVTWATAAVISGPIAHYDLPGTLLGVGGFVALVCITEWCFVYRSRFALRLGEAVVHDLRNRIYEHLLRMPIAFFRHSQVGRLVSRVTSDVDVVRVGVQDAAFVTTVQLGTLVVSAALMVYYDWQLFFVVLSMAPVLWTLVRYFRQKLSQAYRAQQESFSRVTARLAESVQGMREIQGFVRQDVNGGLFGQLIRDHSRYNYGAAKQQAVFQPLLELNGQLFLSILVVVGGYQALRGEVRLDALIQFLFLSNAFFGAIPIIGNQFNQALTAMAGAERVFALLETPPAWEDAADARDVPPLAGDVEFRNVSFEYVPGRVVLDDVSFSARSGQTVALVGHTGGGKSTIVSLIAKLYLPKSGQILLDGVDVGAITSRSLHRQIAAVTQENFLFTGTVLENLRMGKPDATLEQARAAADALGVLDLIEDLPRGFETEVGEQGGSLSLGERQILCFVRAMLADPRILLLDEATSSIDSLTEARVQQALSKLLAGRTSFVVAHRLSTIRHADVVFVIDHGRIVERGTHTELLAASGRYAALYREFMTATELAETNTPSQGRESR